MSNYFTHALGMILLVWGAIFVVTVLLSGIEYGIEKFDPTDEDNEYNQTLPEEIWDGVAWFIWLGYMTIAIVIVLGGLYLLEQY